MLSASSEFNFTGRGGIWLIIPGIDIILHHIEQESTSLSGMRHIQMHIRNDYKII